MKIYAINSQISGYDDRHEFGDWLVGFPSVGIVPSGHRIIFERAIRKEGFDSPSIERLEGHVTWDGKTYPISYALGFGEGCNDGSGGLMHNFRIVTVKAQEGE